MWLELWYVSVSDFTDLQSKLNDVIKFCADGSCKI